MPFLQVTNTMSRESGRKACGAVAEPVRLDEVEAAVGEPAPGALGVAGHRAVVAAAARDDVAEVVDDRVGPEEPPGGVLAFDEARRGERGIVRAEDRLESLEADLPRGERLAVRLAADDAEERHVGGVLLDDAEHARVGAGLDEALVLHAARADGGGDFGGMLPELVASTSSNVQMPKGVGQSSMFW